MVIAIPREPISINTRRPTFLKLVLILELKKKPKRVSILDDEDGNHRCGKVLNSSASGKDARCLAIESNVLLEDRRSIV